MKYLIIGYIKGRNEQYQSTADTEEEAAKKAAYMLALKNVYKIEIVKSQKND